jgi:hypothetical protein
MNHLSFDTRNEALVFARRTHQNLKFIKEARAKGEDVHEVTQLALSLLGLVVFPKEKLLIDKTKRMTISEMKNKGWPDFKITLENDKAPTSTLFDIIYHLRNAVAHGRLFFTSDSPISKEVAIIIEDKKPKDTKPYWRAEIDAPSLNAFCLNFIEFIDDSIG